jgi:hypothetical protein
MTMPKIEFSETDPKQARVVFEVPGKSAQFKAGVSLGAFVSAAIFVGGALIAFGGWKATRAIETAGLKSSVATLQASCVKNDSLHVQFGKFMAVQWKINENQEKLNDKWDKILLDRALRSSR